MNNVFTEKDRLFIVLVSLLVVFMWIASSMIFTDGGVKKYTIEKKNVIKLVPQKIEEIPQKNSDIPIKRYYLNGKTIRNNGGCLQFYSHYTAINIEEMYTTGEKKCVYRVEKSNSPFGRNSGTRFNFALISPQVQKVIVETKDDFSMTSKPITFECGEESTLYYNFIIKNLSRYALVTIELLLGIYIIISYWLVGYKKKRQRYILYYGTLLMYMGMWCSLEMDILNVLFDNSSSVYFMIYGILLTVPIPFILFVDSYYGVKYNWFSEIIKLVSAIQAFIYVVLQLLGIIEFREILTWIQIVLTAMNGYLIYVSYLFFKNNKDTVYKIEKITETCGLLIGYVLAVLSYRMMHFENNFYVLVLVVAYSVGVWYNITKREIVLDEENKRIEIYRSQAEYDILTNIKNRNSFENFMFGLKEYSGYSVCVFDVNNLKHCNDTYGHKAGDRLIVACANCIKDVFEKLGDVYRIGGDEFCVILKKRDKKDIELLLDDLKSLQDEYNKSNHEVKMEVAAGYAIFSTKYDDNLENTFSRADKMMYYNKRNIKEKTN
ncbi:GGDEF domain-containing protein [Lachnobacterium bovis]|uniref:Diguanylate cyclase (GGDEF) domain-containing protein n=1 Tax=Lachnobacterium bovis TaxID=140626 RepID=A0A1H9R1H1_9FIRM|nr:GGDEF domain-containing protein [Lachnobacterium bovis]SER66570.1 diguanylate cyclase (GGDEF) domain-containing protein [Lachnobacterium bovis]